MELETRKLEFVKEFLKLQNEKLIGRFEDILKKETRANDDENFKPMSMEEFQARIDKSLADSKAGRIIAAEDLREEVKKWH